jgi:hypothetical protein
LASKELVEIFPRYLAKLLNDPKVPEVDKNQIKDLKESLNGEKALPTNLLS